MAPPDAVSTEAASRFALTIRRLLGSPHLRIELWDGTVSGDGGDDAVVMRFRSARALDRLLGAMPERGFGRAYTEGLIEIEPLEEFLAAFAVVPHRRILSAAPGLLRAVLALGGRPDLRPTPEVEVNLHGRRHSPARDAAAIQHHYDLPEAFYALWLDSTLTYSCAYFDTPTDDLDTAQRAKLDLVCQKLRLRRGERVLDVGCGWGSFAIHAAANHGVEVVGITLSPRQVDVARRRVQEHGLEGRVTIALADYREPLSETFDAIASIGMVEHVGRRRMREFGDSLRRALRPGGRLLLHGITIPEGAGWNRGSFTDAFVFPDGELEGISSRDAEIAQCGFELRDVECLREHYALTLERWVAALRARWDEAIALVGEERARVWLLYMTGAMVSFRLGTASIYQSLFVRPFPGGDSGLPLRRADWYQARSEPALIGIN